MGFRLLLTDAFGGTFSINVYGAGRDGWFVASRRDIESRDSGWRVLKKGEWPTLINLIDQCCGFWGLPEILPWPENTTVDDGEWLNLTGRDRERFHHIERFVWRERGLDTVVAFLRQISGLFPPPIPPTPPSEGVM